MKDNWHVGKSAVFLSVLFAVCIIILAVSPLETYASELGEDPVETEGLITVIATVSIGGTVYNVDTADEAVDTLDEIFALYLTENSTVVISVAEGQTLSGWTGSSIPDNISSLRISGAGTFVPSSGVLYCRGIPFSFSGGVLSGSVFGGSPSAAVSSSDITLSGGSISGVISTGGAQGIQSATVDTPALKVSGSFFIPSGATLVLSPNAVMTITAGGILTVADGAAASIDPSASIVNNGTIQGNTALLSPDGGEPEPPVAASYLLTIPGTSNFGSLTRNSGWHTVPFTVSLSGAVMPENATITISVQNADYTLRLPDGRAALRYYLFNVPEGGTYLGRNAVFCTFINGTASEGQTAVSPEGTASVSGRLMTDSSTISLAGIYTDSIVFVSAYSEA